jgi:hypothetical protein
MYILIYSSSIYHWWYSSRSRKRKKSRKRKTKKWSTIRIFMSSFFEMSSKLSHI